MRSENNVGEMNMMRTLDDDRVAKNTHRLDEVVAALGNFASRKKDPNVIDRVLRRLAPNPFLGQSSRRKLQALAMRFGIR